MICMQYIKRECPGDTFATTAVGDHLKKEKEPPKVEEEEK